MTTETQRMRQVNMDGLYSNRDHLGEFRETKYAAPLKEQQYLDKLQEEVTKSLALVESQMQAKQDLQASVTFVQNDVESNVSSFVGLDKNQSLDAEFEAKKHAENINKLGFDVTIHEFNHGDGVKTYDVEAHMPEKYKDRDPMTMQLAELKDAQKEVQEEKSGDKAPSTQFKPVDVEKFMVQQLGKVME